MLWRELLGKLQSHAFTNTHTRAPQRIRLDSQECQCTLPWPFFYQSIRQHVSQVGTIVLCGPQEGRSQ